MFNDLNRGIKFKTGIDNCLTIKPLHGDADVLSVSEVLMKVPIFEQQLKCQGPTSQCYRFFIEQN